MAEHFPCPCCGHLVFVEHPGSHAICPICFWNDDAIQLRWPDYTGGANRLSLRESQVNVALVGAKEERVVAMVRTVGPEDRLEPTWRPIDDATDVFEPPDSNERPWPADLTVLYWWRPSFWRSCSTPNAAPAGPPSN